MLMTLGDPAWSLLAIVDRHMTNNRAQVIFKSIMCIAYPSCLHRGNQGCVQGARVLSNGSFFIAVQDISLISFGV